jgi:regulator of sigma E protease
MMILVFAVILGLLIIVHEAGHYFAAKKLGVRVEEFALGFGPKLTSWTFDGTSFRLCLIPLGGYVKMSGDERGKCQGASDEFFTKSPGHRALIAVMGPVVNYVFAYVCFTLVFMLGYLDMDAAVTAMPARIGTVISGSPAALAGLRSGDTILAVNGTTVSGWGEMQDIIADAKGAPLQLSLDRAGEATALQVVPVVEKGKDLFGRERPVSRIGIKPDEDIKPDSRFVRRYGFGRALVEGAKELWMVTAKTYQAFWQMITGQRAAREGMTGLIGIFFIIKFAAGVGFAFLLHIVGVISASLAIFNLLPLIPLDGGHIFLNGLEKLRGRPLSDKADDLLNKAGFALIIVLAVFVFYLDFERIGLIDKILSFLPTKG